MERKNGVFSGMNMKDRIAKIAAMSLGAAMLLGGVGCSSQKFEALNPFAENPEKELGVRSNQAILEDGGTASGDEKARHSLEVMGSYRRAQAPQPAYPVVQPAEVRLMWVPDHLNKSGDLVPAHYYYLRVLNDRWAVQDAFEMEEQLNAGSAGSGGLGGGSGGPTPWVYGNSK